MHAALAVWACRLFSHCEVSSEEGCEERRVRLWNVEDAREEERRRV